MATTRQRSSERRPPERRPAERPAPPPESRRGRRTPTERARTRLRPRPVRRKEVRRRWIALLIVLTIVGLGYIMFFTSFIGVKSVDVVGAKSVPADQVRGVAAVPDLTPMLRVSTVEVRDRVAEMPGVATVEVSRSWPSTIRIIITERTAIAYFDSGPDGDGYHLVDGGGVVFKTVKQKPAGLPELKLPEVSAADPVTQAVTTVLGIIPPQLLKQVTTATAKTPGSVEFTLSNGKTVRWGNAGNTDRKAKVLAALLSREGKTYDVSAPDLPTVS